MTPQEQQIIESLFQRLSQAAAQAGPRDPQAEAFIQQRLASFPGGPYYMAQTLVLQERALQQGGGQGSFLPGGAGSPAPYQPAPGGYGAPPPAYQTGSGGGGMGGFLASAGKMALGVGGGILVADAAMGLAHDLFGQHDSDPAVERAYDQGYQQGFDQGVPPDPGQGGDQTLFDDSSNQWDQAVDQGGDTQLDSFQQDDYQQDDLDLSGDDGGQSW